MNNIKFDLTTMFTALLLLLYFPIASNAQGSPEVIELMPDFCQVTGDQYQEWVQQQFKSANNEVLLQSSGLNNRIVTVCATWELALRKLERSNQEYMSREDKARFIGFIEGVFRIKAPNRWEQLVMESNVGLDGWFQVDRNEIESSPYSFDELNEIFFAPGVSLRFTEQSVGISNKSGEAIISKELLAPNPAGQCVNVEIGAECSFVLLHHRVSSRYQLLCISQSTSDIIWKSTVLGGIPASFSRRKRDGFHEAFIVENDGYMCVFGVNKAGFYIQSFDAEDGVSNGCFLSQAFW